MSRRRHFICCALPLVLSGCATFSTNVEGDFACRAPKGDCAPTSVIDGNAVGISARGYDAMLSQKRLVVGEADTARTRERMMKIIFPAHVDEQGVLHDEASVYAVVEQSKWAVTQRGPSIDTRHRSVGRVVAEQIKAAQSQSTAAPDAGVDARSADDADFDDPILPLASRSVLPSTAREAIAGAHAPVIEGFDMSPLHDRTPRSLAEPTPLQFPDAAAIDAAHKHTSEPKTPNPPETGDDQIVASYKDDREPR